MGSHEFRSEEPAVATPEVKPYVPHGVRKYLDCREIPSIINCSMFMSGEEEHLMQAAVDHMVHAHGHTDSPELRDKIRKDMKAVPAEERLA